MEKLNRITVTEILDVVTISSPKGRFEKMKNRKCYGISFCEQGQITYIHKGKEYVCDSTHAVILPKGESYTIRGDKSGLFPVINFDCADFLCDSVTVLPVDAIDPIMKAFQQMKGLFLFDVNRAKVFSIFYDILHRLSSSISSEHRILLPALRYLEKNYADPELSNDILAAQCGISEVYFRKLFVRTYGIAPRQYIIDTRINVAKQLLTEGIVKIHTIAEQCGFSNPHHFCRLFKQKTGLTPTEFMKENKLYKI